MNLKTKDNNNRRERQSEHPSGSGPGTEVAISDEEPCLDTIQLNLLEKSFRMWTVSSNRSDVRMSRRRISILFLLIRYTGAKLSEALAMNPLEDFDSERRTIFFRGDNSDTESNPREVQISEILSRDIRQALADRSFRKYWKNNLKIDPGFVRRKFYERAHSCGFPKRSGGPEAIRKARAVELMRGRMPLPAIQSMVGPSMPHLASSRVSFTKEEIQQATRVFLEKESARKTSARNSFFGKIHKIRRGEIQSMVGMATVEGHSIITVVTNHSADTLALSEGKMVTAEVKAPWVVLQSGDRTPECSAENMFLGVVENIIEGGVNIEYSVHISEGLRLCAVASAEGGNRLNVRAGDRVWAIFNCYAVVLHTD